MTPVYYGIILDIATHDVGKVAKNISDLGMMAVTAAFFLILTGLLWVACFKWFKKIIDDMIRGNAQMIKDLLSETRKQNDMLNDISEGLRPETQLRIKNMSGAHFDLAVEKVVQMISRIRKENHIADKEKTRNKIRILITNLHEDRKSRFDSFTFHGKKVSEYTNPEWVDWVAEVVEQEVYAPKPNHERTYTNVKAVYEKIKLDFYNHLKAVSNG